VIFCNKHSNLYASWCSECLKDEREPMAAADTLAASVDELASALEAASKPYLGQLVVLDSHGVRDALGHLLVARALYKVARGSK
jgi:hypothetical protein